MTDDQPRRPVRLIGGPHGLLCQAGQNDLWEIRSVSARSATGNWQTLSLSSVLSSHEVGRSFTLPLHLDLQFPDGQRGTLELEESAGAALQVTLSVLNAVWCAVDFSAAPDEHYLGMGERFNDIDQRGNEVLLQVVNGASGNLAYKPVPFLISSKGYGLHLNTDLSANLRLAVPDDESVASVRVQGEEVRLRMYHGQPRQVLEAYTAEAGRPAVPPAWAFGPWKSRDWTTEDQSTALEDIRQTRQLDIAGSVKLIDAKWERVEHDFAFDTHKYPDAPGLIREARDNGFRMILWLSPWLVYEKGANEAFDEAAANGYLIKNRQGETYVHRLGNSPTFLGSCVDFTNPAAVKWWQENIRALVRLGIDGFKTDFGEQVPDDAVFHDGRSGAELHNIFPRLYNQITYQAMQEETDGILLARSAWHGSQGISAIWAGDQSSDFGPATGLESVIKAGQNAGVSGFPYWASDIGGYFGVPTDEVFIRWTQFGAFSPIMQVHGMGNREPWNFSPEALAIYRAYAQLHTDLFPYLHHYAHEASRTGIPMMRPLAFEYPEDPGIWGDTQEHQYFFGAELLVAPVYYGFTPHRHAWLPAGNDWFDLWTGTRHAGGEYVTVAAPLDRIPVFARAGSLLPLLAASPRTLDCEHNDPLAAWPDLRVLVYPGKDAQFDLTDGTRLQWHDDSAELVVSDSPRARTVTVSLMQNVPFTLPNLNHDTTPLATDAALRLQLTPIPSSTRFGGRVRPAEKEG